MGGSARTRGRANASQIIAVDRAFLTERVAKLPPRHFAQVMTGEAA